MRISEPQELEEYALKALALVLADPDLWACHRFKSDLANGNEADSLWILEHAHLGILSEVAA